MQYDKQMELFADGGLKDQGGSVDEVSGNNVPAGSLKEEVRDDIDAKLSEGEFVLPADVVRFYGLAHIMKMRDVAKAGLSKMESMGQMGNSDEAIMEDDMPFSMEDLEVEDEEGNSMEYANGGYVRNFEVGGYNPATGTTTTGNTGISYMPASTFGTPVAPVTPVNPIVNTTMPQYNLQAAPQGGFTYKMPEGFTTPVLPKQQDVLGTKDGLPPSTKMGKYTNAAGETMEIPLDGLGNPLYDVPVGYTRVDEAPAAPVAPSVEAPTAPTQNNEGRDKAIEDSMPAKKGIDWDNIGYDKLFEVGTEITSPAAKTAMGIFSAIPGIGLFVGAASTHQNRKLDAALVNQFNNPTLKPEQKQALSDIYASNSSFLSRLFTDRPSTLEEAAKGGEYKEPTVDPSVVAQTKELSKGTAGLTPSAVKSINVTATAAMNASIIAQKKRDGVAAEYSEKGYTGTTVNNMVSTAGKISGVEQKGKTGVLSGVVVNDRDRDNNGNPTGTAARTEGTNRTVFSNADGSTYAKTGFLGTGTVDVVKDPKTGQYKETGTNDNGGKEKEDKSAVCTAFRNLGYLPDDIWALDDIFGKSLEKTNPTMVKGYRLWAVPVAKFIQTNTLPARTLRAIMWPITKAWASEMAHKLKPEEYKPNLSGKAIMFIGGSICSLIGYVHNMSCKQNGELV